MIMNCSQLIALFLVLLCVASAKLDGPSSQHSFVITVSKQGDLSCHKHHPVCKTLEGALNVLNQVGSDKVFINVTCNQNITSELQYEFSLRHDLSVVVSSLSEIPNLINCSSANSLSIKNNHGSYSLSWTWKNIEFYGCYKYNKTKNQLTPGIVHQGLNSVVFTHCVLRVSYMKISNVNNIVVEHNQLGNDICPELLFVSTTSHKEMSTVSIVNNTISNCLVDSPSYALVTLQSYVHTKVTILNNTFSDINTSSIFFQNGINLTGSGIVSITVLRNRFIRNRLSFINVQIKHVAPPLKAECIIQENTLYDNLDPENSRLLQVNLFRIHYTLSSSASQIILRNNEYHNNDKLYICYVTVVSGNNNCKMTVLIDENDIHNNNVTYGLLRIEKMTPRYGVTKVDIVSLNATSNTVETIQVEDFSGSLSSVLSIINVDEVHVADVTFTQNLGTPLLIQTELDLGTIALNLSGTLIFSENIGLLGGACAFQNVIIDLSSSPVLVFDRNHAVLGGAVYLVYSSIANTTCDEAKIDFIDNTAATAGDAIFFATDPYTIINTTRCDWLANLNENNVSSLAKTLTSMQQNLTIFPGQNIVLNVTIVDYFGSPSSCTANVNLLCDGSLYKCYSNQIKLNGPSVVVIAQTPGTNNTKVNTNIVLSSPENLRDTKVSMVLTCRNSGFTKLKINLNITSCPLGFVYNYDESVCKCTDFQTDEFICSEELGLACASLNYWYGPVYIDHVHNVTVNGFGNCFFPECIKMNSNQCPHSMNYKGRYFLLNSTNQCSPERGGVLCRGCAKGFHFTFTSTICVSGDCLWWQSLLVIIISLSIHIFVAILALFLVRFKLGVGSGFLYGPMLFLAVINILPYDGIPGYIYLHKAVSIITSIPLMNLEVFGFIPWCFFPSLARIYNYSLRYLGPMVVLLVMAIAAAISRWGPTSIHWWRGSPIRAICILILLSFWSLVDTSVRILRYHQITYLINGTKAEDHSVVSLQPDMEYFSQQHLPVAIPALLVLIVMVIPLVTILLFSSLFSKWVNLHRIKPFLDEFQSCYKDRCRWFSVIFFTIWIIITCFHSNAVFMQTLFAGVLSLHVLLQPYQSKVLNVTDTLLLVNINVLQAIMQFKKSTTPEAVVVVHLITIGTLVCLAAWFVCVCLYKSKLLTKFPVPRFWTRLTQHFTNTSNKQLMTSCDSLREELHSSSQLSWSEREPLIAIVNNALN